jgi:hypothetical protein
MKFRIFHLTTTSNVHFTSINFGDAARQSQAKRSFLLLVNPVDDMSGVFIRDQQHEFDGRAPLLRHSGLLSKRLL